MSIPQPPQVATAAHVKEKWRVSSPNVGLGADESLPLSQDEVREKLPRSLYSKDEGGLDDGERWKRRKLSIPPPPVQLRPPPSVRARPEVAAVSSRSRWHWALDERPGHRPSRSRAPAGLPPQFPADP